MKKEKILIVGADSVGANFAQSAEINLAIHRAAKEELGPGIIVLGEKGEKGAKLSFPLHTTEINGIRYIKKEVDRAAGRRGHLAALLSNAIPYVNPYSLNEPPVGRKRPEVDLEKEFELIGQKKSTLSRSDRDWVVEQFNKIYIPFYDAT